MNGDKDSTKAVTLGSIMQVNPGAKLENGHDGQLGVVQLLHSWGAILQFTDGQNWPVTWEHMEPTGGKAIWDKNGKKLREPKAPPKHHA